MSLSPRTEVEYVYIEGGNEIEWIELDVGHLA